MNTAANHAPRVLSEWKTTCRCGTSLSFSCEDIKTGRPAEGADYWCSDPNPETGPHDWGVVVYRKDSE